MDYRNFSSVKTERHLLFVTPILSFPPRGGPEIRVWNTLQAMARIQNLKVSVLHLTQGAKNSKVSQELQKIFESRFGGYFAIDHHFEGWGPAKALLLRNLLRIPRIGKLITGVWLVDNISRRRGCSVVWFGYGSLSPHTLWGYRILRRQLSVVYDTDSWAKFLLRTAQHAKGSSRLRIFISARLKRFEEGFLSRMSDVTVAVSETEAKEYRSVAPNKTIVLVVSNVVDEFPAVGVKRVTTSHISRDATKTILLTGTFGFKNSPMDFGTDWFIREVWPQVQKSKPDTKLVIAGRDADRMWAQVSSDHVQVIGSGDDFSKYFHKSDICIVPLWFESGTRIKILQAGLANLAVVSTSLGAEGLDLKDGGEILIADTSATFADAIVRLIKNPALARSISRGLKQRVLRSYGIANAQNQIEAVLGACERSFPLQNPTRFNPVSKVWGRKVLKL